MSVEITKLASGLTVVTDAMPDVATASLGVWIGAGSRHESVHEHGLSHLLEHMAFKGTRRRSARAIAEEIEAAGGEINAATSTEQTAYYARVLAEDTGLALDILADILTDSAFDAGELEKEKSVILQEIASVGDAPDDLVFDMFGDAAFPQQALGRPILGTAETVTGFDRDAIEVYLRRCYRAPATIVAAAGAIEHEAIVSEAAARFTGLGGGAAPQVAAARYTGGESKLRRKLEQAHLVIGFEGVSFNDPRYYAAHLFASAIGGGMSSRLFQTVREERGLAYAINAFHWSWADAGVLGFYAATAGRDVAELVPVTLDCLAEATRDLSQGELDRARAQMKVAMLAALESSSARAEQIARQLLAFGRVLPREEVVARIESATLEEVRSAGATMLATAPTVASIGPVAKVPPPARIAAHLAGL